MGVYPSNVAIDAPPHVQMTAKAIRAAKSSAIAAASVAWYDWLVCLADEIKLIWKSPPSLLKYSALACRYASLVHSVVLTITRFGNWSDEGCRRLATCLVVSTDLSIFGVTLVLAIRAAAVYSYNLKICSVIVVAVLIQTTATVYGSTLWKTTPLPEGVTGCFPRPGPSQSLSVSMYWPPMLLTDFVLFFITTYRVYPIWQDSNGESKLAWILLRDEIMYYGLVLALDTTTVILLYLPKDILGSIMASPTVILSSIISTHLVLNVRAVSVHKADSQPQSTYSPLTMERILAVGCRSTTSTGIITPATHVEVGRSASHVANLEGGRRQQRGRKSIVRAGQEIVEAEQLVSTVETIRR